MALDPCPVEKDVSGKHVTAEQILNHKRGNVALTTTRVLRRPTVIFVGRIEAPRVADRLLDIRKRQHIYSGALHGPGSRVTG